MTAPPASILSLQTGEDAFVHHPLPTVRALERDLRKTMDANRAKLRSLVGASYRDLLGTAERIVEMDAQMATLERGLGDMGRRCDARALERAGSNWAGMKERRRGEGDDEIGRVASVAQIKVVQGCLTLVGRVVKGRGDGLLGAKVLVLARLLVNSTEESGKTPAVLESLRKKLAVLRKKLLLYLERTLIHAGADKATLAHTLCAYALVTSSTSKEVLRHFLQVSFRQLESKAESPGRGEVMEMLDLYSQSLLDTKDLFPRRLADALAQLAKVPLLRDAQVQGSHELQLDIYGQWIAEDVRTFTPWVRHDQVTSIEVGTALASWMTQAHQCLLTGLGEHLEKQNDLSVVVESRHIILCKFMALRSRLRTSTHANAIDNVRDAFLTRIKSLVADSAKLVDLNITMGSLGPQHVVKKDSLWELATHDVDLSDGARSFRRSVVQRRHGRDSALDAEIAKLDIWVSRIQRSLDDIENMRTRKWDDDLDFDPDDLDDGEELLGALSRQDPERSVEGLREAAQNAVVRNVAELQAAGEQASDPAYLLRLWRELDARSRLLQARLSITPAQASVQAIHRGLALSTSQGAIDAYTRSTYAPAHVATTLWDGTPPLPVQAGPAAFQFLTALHRAMSEAGDDLWSVECLAELGRVVDRALGAAWSGADGVGEGGSSSANGDDEGGAEGSGSAAAAPTHRDRVVQELFDAVYLAQVFGHVGDSGLGQRIARMQEHVELDPASRQRMEKGAKEYWRRSHLLFGLLASASARNGAKD